MTNNLSDILLWIESPDNFSKGIGSLDSKDQIKKYSELISIVVSKPVQEWMALGEAKLEESNRSLSEMGKSVSSLINHFENQEDFYQKDHFEGMVGLPHVYDVYPPKGISEERLEAIKQEGFERDKKTVENTRKNKEAILYGLHSNLVILNSWSNELIDQMKTIKRSMVQLRIEANSPNPEQSFPGPDPITDQKIEDAFRYMKGLDPMKQKRILSDAEFENLIIWVKSYFANEHTIPEIHSPIRNVFTTRGNVYTTFKYLYRDFHAIGKIPDSLYNLIKACFYEYRDDNIDNMKKTKEPDHYNELIRKSE